MFGTILVAALLVTDPGDDWRALISTTMATVTMDSVAHDSVDSPVQVETPAESDEPIVLVRLPGRQNWFKCPGCGSSTDLMYLGEHLRGEHEQDWNYLNKVGYDQWPVLHDNIHNAQRDPEQQTNLFSGRTKCSGGRCGLPILRRFRRK